MTEGLFHADGAQYLGFGLPFSVSQLVWIEAILVGAHPLDTLSRCTLLCLSPHALLSIKHEQHHRNCQPTFTGTQNPSL